jgi:hypothetical protein
MRAGDTNERLKCSIPCESFARIFLFLDPRCGQMMPIRDDGAWLAGGRSA